MKLGMQSYLTQLSFSNTISIIYIFSVERARSTVHMWVHEIDLRPADGRAREHVGVAAPVL